LTSGGNVEEVRWRYGRERERKRPKGRKVESDHERRE
jgi:hypothetical protein